MKKHIQKYAGVLLASAVVITGVAGAANVDPIPSIANTFAVSGQVIKSADLNKLAEGLNILDTRTNNFKNNITVTDNGNVGVGTTTPSAKLHVKGDGYTGLFGYNGGTNNPYLHLGTDEATNLSIINANGSISGGDLAFKSALNETMRITKNGNVGIGTTTPSAKLDVAGPVAFANNKGYLNYYHVGQYDQTEIAAVGSTTSLSLVTNSISRLNITPDGNVGIGTVNPTEKLEVVGNVKATAFLYASDERLKGNIAPLENVLEKVAAMKGVSFDWKNNGKHDIGLIAQDVQKQFPEAVSQGQDGYLAVDYSRMVPVLLEAIKAQQKEIDDLQCQLGDCQ